MFHYASDFLIHFGVVAALILAHFTGLNLWDPLMSILVAGYIIYSIFQIFNNSIAELMDEQLPDDILKDIKKTILSFHPNIKSFHELKTRRVGNTKFIDFHLELKDVHEFERAHQITEDLIAAIKKKYPKSVLNVHTDPEGAE